MKILFVCAHNRFRSKVAEAIFNKYNKNKENESKSAGAAPDYMNKYIAKNVLVALKKKGIEARDEESRQLDQDLLEWADKIILVADNVSPDMFPKEKLEIWKIKDCAEEDIDSIRDRIDKIEVKVKGLINRLR